MHYLNNTATLSSYLVENTTTKLRPAVLILPGGSYLYTSKREGKPVAISFNNAGIHAFVLDYTTYYKKQNITVNEMIDEVISAVEYIVSNASFFQVDIYNISLIGFSAGGHLAAEVANLYPALFKKVILGYPALNIIIDDEKVEPSLELDFVKKAFKTNPTTKITTKNPPTFIWHTQTDETVPISGSIEYVKRLNELKIPLEAHFYQTGMHGLSVGNEITASEEGDRFDLHAASWVNLAISWLLK